MSTDALREATERLQEARDELALRLEEANAARRAQQATVDATAPAARPRATREAIVRLVYDRRTGYEPELYLGSGRDARKLTNVSRLVLEQDAGPDGIPQLTLTTLFPELPAELEMFAQVVDASAARLLLAKYALREAMSMARLEEAVRCAVEAMHTTNWRDMPPERAAEMRRDLIQACVDSAKSRTRQQLERAPSGPDTTLAQAYQCYAEALQFHDEVGVDEDDKDARDIRLDLVEHLELVMALCARLLEERKDKSAPVPPPTYQALTLLPGDQPPVVQLLEHMRRRAAVAGAEAFAEAQLTGEVRMSTLRGETTAEDLMAAAQLREPRTAEELAALHPLELPAKLTMPTDDEIRAAARAAADRHMEALGAGPTPAQALGLPDGATLVQHAAAVPDEEPGKVPQLELPPDELLRAAQAQAAQGQLVRDGDVVTPAEAKVIDRMAGAPRGAPATGGEPAPGPAGTPPDAAPGGDS